MDRVFYTTAAYGTCTTRGCLGRTWWQRTRTAQPACYGRLAHHGPVLASVSWSVELSRACAHEHGTGGGSGIRTHGGFTLTRFQGGRHRPLGDPTMAQKHGCHLYAGSSTAAVMYIPAVRWMCDSNARRVFHLTRFRGGRTRPLCESTQSKAEDARFELARGLTQHAFQACALGH